MFCSTAQGAATGGLVTECLADGLSVIPHVLFMITAAASTLIYRWKHRTSDNENTTLRTRLIGHDLRWILTIITVCVYAMELLEGILSELQEDGIRLHLYLPHGVAILGAISSLVFYDFIEVCNVQRFLMVSLLYWCGVLAFQAVRLSSLYANGFTLIYVRLTSTWIVFIICGLIILLDLKFFALKQKWYMWYKTPCSRPAEELENVHYIHSRTNFLSHATWHWLNPMLVKGYKQPLEIADLGNLPTTEHSKENFDMFKKIFEEEKAKARASGKKPSLWKTYWRTYWPMMALGGVYKLLADNMGFVPPMCLDGIITYLVDQVEAEKTNTTLALESGPLTIGAYFRNGYTLTLVSLIAGILQGVLFQNNFFLSVRQGIRCKGAIQALVFDKTLRLSTWSLGEGGMTPGQVMNHMAIDPMHLFMFFYFIHFVWSLPIQVLTTFILLYVQLGTSALISATFILLLIPFQYFIGQMLSKAQKEILEQSDERLKKCNEVLQSIKLLKLYAWETIFRKSIEKTRHREIRLLLRAAAFRVLSIFVVDGAPLAATLITFTIYPYIENEPLKAAKVFSSLTLFNILSLPLYIVTMIINIVAHARVSTNRLLPFLLAPEVKAVCLQRDGNGTETEPLEMMPFVEVRNKGNGLIPGANSKHCSLPVIKIDFAPDIDQNADSEDETDAPLLTQNGVIVRQDGLNQNETSLEAAMEIQDGCFSWDLDGKEPVLYDINVKIPRGKLTVIVGMVGSGKSSILSALLGEMTTVRGRIIKDKGSNVAYGGQRAWLMNATLRDNILFGSPYDCKRYEEILDCCALVPDISMLPGGDQTEIGEKGINLSGGQKQRISIARTLYADSSIVILDDPMSALDVHVGRHIFCEAINRYLLREEKTVVLVTHQLQYLPYATKILVMKDGHIVQDGSLTEIEECDQDLYQSWKKTFEQSRHQLGMEVKQTEEVGSLKQSQHEANHITSRVEGMKEFSGDTPIRAAVSMVSLATLDNYDDQEPKHVISDSSKDSPYISQEDKEGERGQLIEREERDTGSVGLKVYIAYAKAATILFTVFTILGYMIRQVVRMGTDYWLAKWSDAARDAAIHELYLTSGINTTAGNFTEVPGEEFNVEDYVIPYVILCVTGMVLGLIIIFCLECMCLIAARNLHDSMITAIIQSPMRFFDTTPIGRIINRMAGDTNTIDEKMPVTLDALLFAFFYVLGGIVINAAVMPYFIIVAIPMVLAFMAIQRFYIASCRELQRLDNISRSPILAHFQETLGGLSTIRAYRDQHRFQQRNWQDIDQNNTAFLYLHTANVWMGVRLDILGMVIVFAASLCSITSCLYGYTSPSLTGLAIAYAIMICTFLNWMMRDISETEMWFSSVQRVDNYCHLPSEPYHSDTEVLPGEQWPNAGEIEFDQVSLRYDSSLDPVIHQLSLHVKAGEKIGICGRTGSGKSSLTLGLFRLIDIFEGRILIDNVNISQVPLETLRSQLSIIPQDPVLFGGSVRFNLDPEEVRSDEEVWKALEIAQLKTTISGLPELLNATVTEGGENFSQGQRQLFCLARAFLRDSRILIMDEATASIDMETDALIQEVMKTAFRDRTVITIAHRVATILNSDSVIVLQNGKIIEHDKPENLRTTNSVFASMVLENK